MQELYPSISRLGLLTILTWMLTLAGAGSALGQTNVCGFQPGARFTRAGSPYNFTCDYIIPTNDSLVVEAGAQLNLGIHSLAVNGRLRVRGTQGDSVRITYTPPAAYTGITFNDIGTGSLAYVSFRNTSTVVGSTGLRIDNGPATRPVPVVINCHFYSPSSATDVFVGISAATGMRNTVASRVLLGRSQLAGLSGRLVAYGPNPTYEFSGGIWLSDNDSLAVEAGVRLHMGAYDIFGNGSLRLRGTQRDSIFVESSIAGTSLNLESVGARTAGKVSLAYVSFHHTSTATGSISLRLDDKSAAQPFPAVTNCRFYGSSTVTDIFAGLTVTKGLRNVLARKVLVGRSQLAGLSGQLVAYGPNPTYEFSGGIWLAGADSLTVEAGIRLNMGAYDILGDGNLRLRGTQRDSILVTAATAGAAINLSGAGRVTLAYVSFHNTSTAPTGSSSVALENRSNGQQVPTVTNCHFYGPTTVTDLSLGLMVTHGLRNVVARKVLLGRSQLGGQSPRLVAYGPNPTYEFSGGIWLSGADSLAVEAGVRLNMGTYDIFGDGSLRLRGTQRDSIFITAAPSGSAINLSGAGTVSLAYVSLRNTSTAAGSTLLNLESTNRSLHDCSFSGGETSLALNISATPTLQLSNLRFSNFQSALVVRSGTVTVANSLFRGLAPKFGINATGSSSLSAVNCNFGHPSGPHNALNNPTGLGCQVTNNVCLSTGTLPVAGFEFAINGNDVAFVNTSLNAGTYSWNFGNGTTSTLANPLKTLPAGTYSVCLTARAATAAGCVSPSVCKTVSIMGLASITTNHGGNTGAVSVVVRGGGFVPHMQLVLRRTGQADIAGDTVVTRNVGELTTSFNLTGKALGQWDVVATYPSGAKSTLAGAFTVETGADAEPWVNLTGPSILRVGFRQVYTLAYGNTGNVDAVFIPLLIEGLPKGTVIELLDPILKATELPGFVPLSSFPYDSLKTTVLDSATNTVFRILFLNRIAAGSTGTLNFVFRLSSNALLHNTPTITTSIYEPTIPSIAALHRGQSTTGITECLSAIAGTAVSVATSVLKPAASAILGCVSGIDNIIVSTIHNSYSSNKDVIDHTATYYNWTATAINCTQTVVLVLAPESVVAKAFVTEGALLYQLLNSQQQAIGGALNTTGATRTCIDALKRRHQSKLRPLTGNATDPNAKYGPGGGSAHHYINKDAPLAYTISFENAATSNLNAQTVRVTDTLSTRAFDFSTFAFTSVTIGTATYALPAPAKSFVHDFDFVAKYGVKARVVGTFDAATGVVRWTFFSIDPATNQVTTNALLGFLPPDVVSPLGQGYVSFTVAANAARQTGDIISNRATIVFDYNPPIRTNAWSNVFDLVKPTSRVTVVTPTAADSVVQVSWTGTDVGSGVQTYDLLFSENGGAPLTWQANISGTSTAFTGKLGAKYCFYTVARDSAGNVEANPVVPGMCYTLTAGPNTAAQGSFLLYPNPATGVVTVEANAQQAGQSGLTVANVVGQVVYSYTISLAGGIQHRQLDVSALAPGLYFVRMSIDGHAVVRKLVKR